MSENVFRFFLGYVVFQQMLDVAIRIFVEIPNEFDKNHGCNAAGKPHLNC